jgi:hypothetical protein
MLMKRFIVASVTAVALAYSANVYTAFSYHRCGIDVDAYRKAALTGDLVSVEALAFYWNFCEAKQHEALFWLRFAHELGSVKATHSLATMLNTIDPQRYKKRTIELYEIAAASADDACTSGLSLEALARISERDGDVGGALLYLKRGLEVGALGAAMDFVEFVWRHRLESEYELAIAVAESAKRHMYPNSVGRVSMESHVDHFRSARLSDAAGESPRDRVSIENLCEL